MRPSEAVAEVLDQLGAHQPQDPVETVSLLRITQLLQWLPRPFDEQADPTHVTGSAIVRDQRGRFLVHRHKRLGRWLQPGGHLERDELPWEGAVRETNEETGLQATHPTDGPTLVHLDVHEGPRGHVHLDLRYLLFADSDSPFRPAAGESADIDWVAATDARITDASLISAIRAADRGLLSPR